MATKENTSSTPATIITATAVSVDAKPVEVHAQAERQPRTELERLGLENETIGVCRRCRRQFVRPPGVHDGSAQYYRCQECAGLKFEDILYSCIIS